MDSVSTAKAKKLAKEFVEVVNEMDEAEKELNSSAGGYHYNSPKHRGAVRRKSMDLTRALAEMRKA